jgi:hypothetical protein
MLKRKCSTDFHTSMPLPAELLAAAYATCKVLREASAYASQHLYLRVPDYHSWFRGTARVANICDKTAHMLATSKAKALIVVCHDSLCTDAAAVALATCPTLEFVDLSSCPHLTDAAAVALATCPILQSVYLSYCYKLTDAAAVALATLPNLKYVDLSGCRQLTDAAGMVLATCPTRKL